MELVIPFGGRLNELYLPQDRVAVEKTAAHDYPSWDLTPRQLIEVELLLSGALSPLDGYMGRKDFEAVHESMQLTNGGFWPLPLSLTVDESFGKEINPGDTIALRDAMGVLISTMTVSDIWQHKKAYETDKLFPDTTAGYTTAELEQKYYLGGQLKGIEPPGHYDFNQYRYTPAALRALFQKQGWSRVVAYQTTDQMHRAHMDSVYAMAKQAEANLLIQPLLGEIQAGDMEHYARIRCFEHILKSSAEQTTMMSLLPFAQHLAGPRAMLCRAIICQNYGCTHFIHWEDPENQGKADVIAPYEKELAIEMLSSPVMAYVQERGQYIPLAQAAASETVLHISDEEFHRRLQEDIQIPDWYTYPEVLAELRKAYPPRYKQGFTVFLTGLSGAGKSTIAQALLVKLMEAGERAVTLLDGDIVRKRLSSELGFSKAHRNLNILRIGYVASEITKNGGIAICAPIAPYRGTRREVRAMIEQQGGFVEIHVATSLEACEARDRKGLYAKARAGLIKEFTGISDPYEEPEKPELRIDTQDCTPEEAAQRVVLKLEHLGYIR